nr:MAG TPA: hypothetical protein [Caudoviricetes sp.]
MQQNLKPETNAIFGKGCPATVPPNDRACSSL